MDKLKDNLDNKITFNTQKLMVLFLTERQKNAFGDLYSLQKPIFHIKKLNNTKTTCILY